jgi:hypothetical protein
MINKKALSEMVGYVLLVVIAVGLSVAVFVFLRSYIPVDTVECSSDMVLVVQNSSCFWQGGEYKLQLVLSNKGLFNINAAYLRFATENRKVKPLINDALSPGGVYLFSSSNNSLSPGTSFTTIPYSLGRFSINTAGKYGLEVQPAIFKGESIKLALCSNSIITQTVNCPAHS